ncbi:TOBE domain-containing protein [Paraclostridium sp. AKS73]|nr:TOBE domain-containing protein [Paraclostridium sp. AKS73]
MISKEDINICDLEYETGIEGTVESKIYAGDITYYNVKVKGTLLKVSSNNGSYEKGEHVKLEVNLRNVVYFK